MNKIILTSLIIVGSVISFYSQSGQKWATGGNSNSTGDFLGTTNNFPLDFKTNNVLRMSLGTNGVLKLNALAGSNTRLLQVDANGNIISLPQGTANQYLSGTGVWVNVPSGSNFWNANGTSLFYNGGYVGIGTNTPLFPLDVIGDARISNNLYVGGGIVITDKVRATGDVKTGRLEADTIKLDASRIITGETNIFGDTKLKFKLDVSGPSTFNDFTQFNQQVNMQSNFNALGTAYFGNNVQLNKGFTFDGNIGISMFQATPTSQKIFSYGAPVNSVLSSCAAGPAQQTWGAHHFGGLFQIYDADPITGVYNANSGLLNFQTWGGGSSIDASIGGQTGSGGLLLNYFCGNDVAICTGANGGRVSMGNKVEIGSPYPPNANTALNIKGDVDFSGLNLVTNHTGDFNYNTALTVNRDATKAIGIFKFNGTTNIEKFVIWGTGRTDIRAATKTDKYLVVNDESLSGSPVEAFAVYGSGKTEIKIAASSADKVAFSVTDLNTNKMNFRVKADGFVHAREVEILNTSVAFPDYVFAKDYELLSLTDVENYISKNKHLPGFENAEYYEKNGIKSSEMFIKQQEKIEELTLYIIELEKRMKTIEESSKH